MRSSPAFWHSPDPNSAMHRWQQRCLRPLAWFYGCIIGWRLRQSRNTSPLPRPVVVVGNIVVGGSGKTPTIIALTELCAALRIRPHLVSRGYGGRMRGPTRISEQSAWQEVGDEPLCLSQYAPVWVSKRRREGCLAAMKNGAKWVFCDDGLQDAEMSYHTRLLVIDGPYGLGNEQLLPAGPLRESWPDILQRIDAMLIIGQDAQQLGKQAANVGIPVFHGQLQPNQGLASWLHGREIIAFAGIGRPEKFRDTLTEIGATILDWHPFPDHHPYQRTDIEALLAQAKQRNATLVTTTKDAVKIPEALRQQLVVLPIALHIQQETEWRAWWRQRFSMTPAHQRDQRDED